MRKKRTRKWTESKVIQEITDLYNAGAYLTKKENVKEYKNLEAAARRVFGTLQKAYEAAGIDYSTVKSNNHWTKERVQEGLLEISKRGESYLSYSSLRRINDSLLQASVRHFGSLDEALLSIGYDYKKIKQNSMVSGFKKITKWSREDVIKEIKNLHEKGVSLSLVSIREVNRSLYDGACSRFGSWGNAVEASEVDYEMERNIWTKNKILSWIQSRLENGESINLMAVRSYNSNIERAACRKFGSWKKAVESLGVDYENEIKQSRHGFWDKEKVLDFIKEIHLNGEPLNFGYIITNHSEVYHAARKYFGTYENAVNESGLVSYADVFDDIYHTQLAGRKFERLVDELLKDLSIDYEKYKHDKWKPDYVLANGTWFDAKLSEWTIFGSETIERYEPHCRMLSIIYMRGDKDKDKMITPKTRMISVHNLIKQLPKHRQIYYLNWINEIETELSEVGNRSTESSDISA